MKSKRMANIELLRMIAMLMVITLHYLDKGLFLPSHLGEYTMNGSLAWFLKAFSIVAVNVYVLITGYFLVEAKFRCIKALQLMGQVLFYSLLIPLLMIVLGMLQLESIGINQWIQYCLPILSEHYWFASTYVILYIFSPVLNVAIRNMKQKQLKITIVIILIVFVIPKTFIPIELAMDQKGYRDPLWFFCLYFIAAYIKLYGISFFNSFRRSIIVYSGSVLSIFASSFLVSLFVKKTGMFDSFILRAYDYNHLLVLLGAVSLFYSFLYLPIKDGKFANLVFKISPYTFGVYLLHEHLEIRLLWTSWLRLELGGSLGFLIAYIISIVIVFIIGISVDFFRSLLFQCVGKKLTKTRFHGWLNTIDEKVNG